QYVRRLRFRWGSVDAVAVVCGRFRDVLRLQPVVDWFPRLAAVVGPEGARGRNSDVHTSRSFWVQQDCVQAHPAGAGLPFWSCAVAAKPGELMPALSAVGRAEYGRVFHSGINRVRICERWFEMPD